MTSVPPAQPPAAPETDVSEYGRQADLCDALVRLLHNYGDGGIWEEFDKDNAILVANVIVDSAPVRALLADLDAARERVRVVEGERDAWKLRRDAAVEQCRFLHQDGKTREQWHLDNCGAMQAIAEDIAYQHAATIDGEYGCCHDEEALRAGGRVPEFDGDEFDPIPDDCPGKQTLDRHLACIAREGR